MFTTRPVEKSEDQYIAEVVLEAAQKGFKKLCEILLPHISKIEDIQDVEYGGNPLHWAAYNGHLNIVTLLIETFPDLLNTKSKNGSTALVNAEVNGHMETVKFLLLKGANKESLQKREKLKGVCDDLPWYSLFKPDNNANTVSWNGIETDIDQDNPEQLQKQLKM
ncbi:MAG: ankyrin repeat domain-containing protein [Gammaproteobacteria bacterium]|nr:MAG: ankyrin repeat domain-containing protein [Gammaproteobacteria bacterium]